MPGIAPCFAAALAVAALGIYFHRAPEPRAELSESGKQLLLAKWEIGTFTPVADSLDLRERLTKFVESERPSKTLTQGQRSKLANAIQRAILCYRDGTPEAFLKFRLPSGNTASIIWATNKLSEMRKVVLGPDNESVEKSEDMDRLELLRRYISAAKDAVVVATGEKYYCLGCWDGIDFRQMALRVLRSARPPEPLIQTVIRSDNLGGHSPNPIVTYSPSPSELAKRDKQVVCGIVSFLVHTSGKVRAYPVYLQWYWVPEISDWLPLELHVAIATSSVAYLF